MGKAGIFGRQGDSFIGIRVVFCLAGIPGVKGSPGQKFG
jgi:hypothetical protein